MRSASVQQRLYFNDAAQYGKSEGPATAVPGYRNLPLGGFVVIMSVAARRAHQFETIPQQRGLNFARRYVPNPSVLDWHRQQLGKA